MNYTNIGKQCFVLLLIFMINGCMFRFAPKIPPMLTTNTYSVEAFNNDYKSYTSSPSTILRDKMIFSVAGEIDKSYMEFRNTLFRGTALGQTSLQMAQMGLTSAATLAGGEAAKAILAAVATGTAGSALSFGKNFFKEKSSDLLISRMDALRAQKWAQIYTKIHSDVTTYTWYEAERDLVDYFWAGSVQGAIQSIFLESGGKAEEAKKKTNNIIEEKYGRFLGGALAPESEIKELKLLYDGLINTSGPSREERAAKIFKRFNELDPNFTKPISQSSSTNLERVAWIFRYAIEADAKSVRDNLIQAFKDSIQTKIK